MSSSPNKTRLVVMGAGPGGYPAAFLAADKGLDVTVVDEKPNPGGVCLYVGCIPSKALLHVARVIHESQAASAWGLQFPKPQVDLAKLRAWKDQVIGKLTGGLGALSKQRKVKFIQGRAKFLDSHRLAVTRTAGGQEEISFDGAIIATGSRPAMPQALAIDSDRVMDSTSALELPDVPASLLVIGGGYIGLEMGVVYAALGSRVTVVEMTSGLLPGADRDLAEVLAKQLAGRFHEILLDTRVVEMKPIMRGVQVRLMGLDLKEPERTFDRVLVAVGRVPNSQNLGLEQAGVAMDEKGFIQVDGQRRTSQSHIFAIGDVAGGVALAHKATHEGRVAVEAILGEPADFDPASIPAVVFTDPEVAWCGLTETEARQRTIPHTVARFPWAASGRAATLGCGEGLTKLIVDPHTHRVLGCGITGVGAGDLIAEAALALEMGATAEDLARTIHPHPTMSETLMEAAEVYFGASAHYIPRKK